MTDTYFVCFQAGTSGRFVSGITWNLINQLEFSYEYSDANSAHRDSPWALSWDIKSLPEDSPNHLETFKKFNFSRSTSYLNPKGYCLLNTHLFPDFNVIAERFEGSKIILMSYAEDDILEICLNNILKNGVEFYSYPENTEKLHLSKMLPLFEQTLFYKYKEKIDVREHKFTVDDVKILTQNYYKYTKGHLFSSPFKNPIVPEEFIDRTLVLPYRDLFAKTNNGYMGLDKICDFTNSEFSDIIYENYQNYVVGRQRILELYEIK